MRTALIAAGALLLVGFLAGHRLAGIRNELGRERNAIEAQWRQVDATLAGRAALMPRLIETMGDRAAQERATVESIDAVLTGGGPPLEKIAANTRLDTAIARLLVAAEQSPALRADAGFLGLQDELRGAEDRIAVERVKYNDAVMRYNTGIGLFPNNVAARLFGFRRHDAYFRTTGAARPR